MFSMNCEEYGNVFFLNEQTNYSQAYDVKGGIL